jgi:shikimate dehydrogenase
MRPLAPAPRARHIGGSTRVYGIIGDPVSQSCSPAMHNAAFAAAGIDAVYVPFHVRPAELARAVAGLRAADVVGLNVTVPHKQAVLKVLDGLRPRARAYGAVNTILRTRRGLVGDNTDGPGFLAALAAAHRPARGRDVLLIGAGGSARAIAHALVDAGCSHLVVANRTPRRATALVATLRHRRAHATGLDVLQASDALATFDLIVNCTSTGLTGTAPPPVRFAATRPDVLCCDLAYGPVPSRFLRRARLAGRRTMNGTGMLLYQGALAFELWTGRPAPLAVMRRALIRALAAR